MIVLRILLNGLIMAAEIGAVAVVAMLGYAYPFHFAGVTALLSFVLGLKLETARLGYELPFYFEQGGAPRFVLVPVVGLVEASMKAVLAGLAALFTFAGTDRDRLFWVAVVFAITTYAGSSLLRALSVSFHGKPWRWGYFRLAPPLGLLFSAGLATQAALGLIAASSVGDIGWKLVWELPAKPSVSQVSELFFQLKQAFDDFIVTLLGSVMSPEWARVVGVVISVNVLTGFVASVYAAVIATVVHAAEDGLP